MHLLRNGCWNCFCISTDCKFGPSELINDGKNGLLIPVDDVRTYQKKNIILNKK